MALIQNKPLTQSVLVALEGGELGNVLFGDKVTKCFCGRIGWCDHVEQVVADRRDQLAKILDDVGSGIVTIPLFPTAGIWVSILFRRIGSASMWSASIDEDEVTKHFRDPEEDLFLGVLGVDDTRLTVRTMVLQWFKQQQTWTNKPECKSTTHGMMEVRAFKRALDANDQAFLQAYLWRVKWSGMCPGCFDRMNAALAAVPDPEPTRSPWS